MEECWHRNEIGNCATCRREEHDALSGTNGERQTTPLLEDAAGSKDVRNTGWGAGHQQPSAGLLDRSPSSSPVPMAAVTVRAEEQGTLEKHARNGFGWEGDDRLMRNIVLAEVMLNTTVTHEGREKGIFHDRVQDKVAKIAADRIRDLAKKNAAGTHPLFINLNYDIVRRQWRKILEKAELWNKSRKDRGGDANGAGVGPAGEEVTRLWQTIVERRDAVQQENNKMRAAIEKEKKLKNDRTDLALQRVTGRKRHHQADESTPEVSCATAIHWQQAPYPEQLSICIKLLHAHEEVFERMLRWDDHSSSNTHLKRLCQEAKQQCETAARIMPGAHKDAMCCLTEATCAGRWDESREEKF